jgi:xanthine dehydrogenase accessory factor
MKHWHETRQVFEWIATLDAEQRRAALATVVSVRGSAYRREGAKIAVAEDGATVGNVSGGCLEGDVREVALQVIASGKPQLRSYCSSSDEVHAWDLGAGCEGEVKIYVEPAEPLSMIEIALFESATPFAVCRFIDEVPAPDLWHRLVVTTTGHDGRLGRRDFDIALAERVRAMISEKTPSVLMDLDGQRVFVDVYVPPPQLVIISAGNDARPLARFAAEAGFRVTVVDHRPGLLLADRFPADARLVDSGSVELAERVACDKNSYAVVMTHNFSDDEQYLRALVGTPIPYIGILGPRQRTDRLIRNVSAIAAFDVNRVYGPVGLDVGTDGAEQVALAIVAEMLAVRGGRRPRSLRERVAAIQVSDLSS